MKINTSEWKMNYEETINYIHAVSWTGSRPGLQRISELLEKMGNPQDKLRFIHVAGTNGKGSFCAMLSSVLQRAGYKTGLYTSPYVKYFNERMSINGEMISNSLLSEIVSYVRNFAEQMQDKPTEFELISAVAFEYFYRNACDIVVLEVGLGGRLDATNVIKRPVLSVITGIALDHTSLLGDTVEKIAEEKAGICKQGVPVLYGGCDEEAKKVIDKRARALGCKLICVNHSDVTATSFSLDKTSFSFGKYENIQIKLLGTYQPHNCANVITAVEALKELGFDITDDQLLSGLWETVWHARFEVISEHPLIIFDGGHNPEGVSSAIESVKQYFPDKKVRILTGVMRDKDYSYIAKRISEVALEVYTVSPDNTRALGAEEYSHVFSELGIPSYPCPAAKDALSHCISASRADNAPIVALGSLYMYKDLTDAICALKAQEDAP